MKSFVLAAVSAPVVFFSANALGMGIECKGTYAGMREELFLSNLPKAPYDSWLQRGAGREFYFILAPRWNSTLPKDVWPGGLMFELFDVERKESAEVLEFRFAQFKNRGGDFVNFRVLRIKKEGGSAVYYNVGPDGELFQVSEGLVCTLS